MMKGQPDPYEYVEAYGVKIKYLKSMDKKKLKNIIQGLANMLGE